MSTRCQLLFVERDRDSDTLQLDFIGLEPIDMDGLVMPAGTPLAISLAVNDGMSGFEDLLETLQDWASQLATFDFDVVSSRSRPQFVLSRFDRHFVLDLV